MKKIKKVCPYCKGNLKFLDYEDDYIDDFVCVDTKIYVCLTCNKKSFD